MLVDYLAQKAQELVSLKNIQIRLIASHEHELSDISFDCEIDSKILTLSL